MTREEAITMLKKLRTFHNGNYAQAIDMAIEALQTNAPSGDLISRQWLLELYGDYIGDNGEPKYHVPLEVVRQNIKDAPSADAKQGEWIKHKGEWVDLDFYPTKYECSQCHYCVDEGHDSIFCPNCGAKMKGADDE